jgi:hypothetical protein
MATFTKALLSGSTNGKQIKVSAITNGTANTVHTAVAGTSAWDEVWLYAYNDDTSSRILTLLWGGTTEPDNAMRVTLNPRSGRLLVVDGALLQNSLVIKAYADVTNVVLIDGFVNNIV